VTKGNVFLYKRKNTKNPRQSDLYSGDTPHRTNQIASCFDTISLTCKRHLRFYSDLRAVSFLVCTRLYECSLCLMMVYHKKEHLLSSTARTSYFELKVMIIYLNAISAKYWPMI
jgi:hypothetical protein